MQKPVVALFGAEIVVVGVLLPECSSEMKRNIYSTRFRSAGQSSDYGGSRIFIGEGLQSRGAVLAIEEESNLLLRAPPWSKCAFSCQKGATVGGRGAISA